MLDPEACYRALVARDARFDGVFFTGVRTTGIYCRPICPARAPGKARCEFFQRPAEAEKRGYRACFRCRPELAPGMAPVDSISRIVTTSVTRIEEGALNEGSLEDLASELGITSRHLRRAMQQELGVAPIELAQTARLALAKQLLADTSIPLAEVAFASGFSSVRRFNALFRDRFARSPSEVRRSKATAEGSLAVTLSYRAPFAWNELLKFLDARALRGVERVLGDEYIRSVCIGERVGWIRVSHDAPKRALRVCLSPSLAPVTMNVTARVRNLFDLNAHPHAIAAHLGRDRELRPHVRKLAGLRVPGAFDDFEVAMRAVVGQQVSVKAASTLAGRLIDAFGDPINTPSPELTRLAPTAHRIASAKEREFQGVGLPAARLRTLRALASVFASLSQFDAHATASTISTLTAIPGIGPWTANYIAMRARKDPDAFPDADLGLMRALGLSAKELRARSEAWRPWRAYAAMHLWQSYSKGGG